MKKRILALLLAAVLLTNTVPVSVLAEQAPVAPAEVSADPSAESPAGPGTEVMPMDEPEVEPEPQPDPCGTCGVVGCTSEHLNWCDACKKDDCGVDHTVVVEPCSICGVVGCEKEHIRCPVCPNYDCTVWHVYCDVCQKYDCGVDHTRQPVTSAGPSEDHSEDVGKFAVLNVATVTVREGTNGLQGAFYAEDFTRDAIFHIDNWEINDAGALWYQVSFHRGGVQGQFASGWPSDSWILQEDDEGDALRFVELCNACGEPDCGKSHVWCETCKKYDCGVNHTPPVIGCGCCENCTGVEDCDCGCLNCDFYKEPVLPDVPSEPSWGEDPYPELPSLYHPENEVAVYAEELPAGTSLVVEEADVTAQLRAFGVPASKLVFGLDISLDGYQTEALVKVAVSERPGTLIGILHTHGSKTTYIGTAEVLSDGTVEFVTDGFSEFAGFMVDFHYGGVDFSIDGMTSILLSELFEEMGIDEDAYDATSVVFSDPTLVEVTEEGSDWRLTSLESFQTEETLVITFGDGHVIVIDVTDPAAKTANLWGGLGTIDYYQSDSAWIGGGYDITFTLKEAGQNDKNSTVEGFATNKDYRKFTLSFPEDAAYWYKVTYSGGGLSASLDGSKKQVNFTYTGEGTVTVTRYSRDEIVVQGNTIQVDQERFVTLGSTETRYVRVILNNNEQKLMATGSAVFPNIGEDIAKAQLDVYHIWVEKYLYYKLDSQGQKVEHPNTEYRQERVKYIDTEGTTYTYDSTTKTYTIRLMNRYKIQYNGNGSTGGTQVPEQACVWDDTKYVSANTFERKHSATFNPNNGGSATTLWANAVFKNWLGGNGTSYNPGESVTKLSEKPMDTFTMTAQWDFDDITVPAAPANAPKGQHFTGWKDAEGNIYQPGANISDLDKDITLTAQWTANQYTIAFDYNGGHKKDGSATTATHPATYGSTNYYKVDWLEPERTGYTFNGWFTAASGGVQVYTSTGYCIAGTYWNNSNQWIGTSDLKVYAQWTPNKYTYDVVYKSESGKQLETTTVTKEFDTTNTIAPKAFDGYETPASQPVKWDSVETKTITFTYKLIPYTIEYTLDGGTVTNNPTSYNVETATFTLNNPTKTNHTFTGWTGTGLSSASTSVTIAQGSTGNRSYTATWKLNVYTVTFDPNGGRVSPTSKSVTYNEEYGSLPTPNYTGYSFGGWYTAATGGANVTEKTIYHIEGNSTLYAHWTPNEYTYDVVYESESGKQLETTTVTKKFGTTNTIIPKAFDGYETPASQTVKWDSTDKKTITFTYKLVSYTIGYTLDGGTVTGNPTSYNVETATFTLNNPSKTGYDFAGWTGTNLTEATKDVTVEKGSTGNREYTATWTPVPYKIDYELDGGTVNPANYTAYTIESATFTLNNPSKAGYDFAGWVRTDLPETTDAVASVTIEKGSTGNRKYTATWTPITYTIDYELDGGTVTDNPTSYNVETATFTLNNPTKAGYDFAGWVRTDLPETTDAVASVKIEQGSTGDRKYTATWKISRFDLTIITNNTVDDNQNYLFDVSGTAVDGTEVSLTVVLGAEDSQTIVGLPAGTYEVSDHQGWSWRYASTKQDVKYDQVETHTRTFTYTAVIEGKIYWLNGYNYGICEVKENKKTKGGGKR